MSDLVIDDDEICCRCYEDFPVAAEGTSVRMGFLFPLARFSKVVRDLVPDADDDFDFLCGNCYFDLTDEL